MNCDEWFNRLYEILDRDMDETTCKDLMDHMKGCQPCLDRFEFEKRLMEQTKKSCREESCSETIRIRIKTFIKNL